MRPEALMKGPFEKRLLRRRFSRALKDYEGEARVQAEMAEALLQTLLPFDFRRALVLEIGAGTGLFTRKFLAQKRPRLFVASDLVPECRPYLEESLFVVADGEAPPFREEAFDFVLSNATFQWFLDLGKALPRLISLLKPGGVLAFTTFGPETMKEFALKNRPPGLKTLSELRALKPPTVKELEARSWQRVLYFPSPREALFHVRRTGAMGFLPANWSLRELKAWEARYRRLETERGYPLTFEPVLVVWKR